MVRLPRARQLISARQRLGLPACAWVCAALIGCVHVAPYERGLLARPDMTATDIAGRAAHHTESIHEGASRGGDVAESGCGCN